MSDTPITMQEVAKFGRVDTEFALQLERELNAAKERIKRLEEAGDKMVNEGWNEPHLAGLWRQAKEAKP